MPLTGIWRLKERPWKESKMGLGPTDKNNLKSECNHLLQKGENLQINPKLVLELLEENSEIKNLIQWVEDLQSGMYINCVYCGHRYGPAKKTPVSMAEVLKQHIEQCSKHPMSKLKIEHARMLAMLKEFTYKGGDGLCICCNRYEKTGHTPNCRLEQLFKDVESTSMCMDCGKVIKTVEQSKHLKECPKR
jgi:DNA-directed RNA polymerase subunit RPC12/RpoP